MTRRPGTRSSAAVQANPPAAAFPATGSDSSAAPARPNTSRFFCVLCAVISSASGEPVQ